MRYQVANYHNNYQLIYLFLRNTLICCSTGHVDSFCLQFKAKVDGNWRLYHHCIWYERIDYLCKLLCIVILLITIHRTICRTKDSQSLSFSRNTSTLTSMRGIPSLHWIMGPWENPVFRMARLGSITNSWRKSVKIHFVAYLHFVSYLLVSPFCVNHLLINTYKSQ